MWIHKSKIVEDLSFFPDNTFGFVYMVTDQQTNDRYIGKKVLYFNRTLPPLKGQKRKRKKIVESDWKNYYGSHLKIKNLIKEGKEDRFKREILKICFSKKELTYYETKFLFIYEVLENGNSNFLNDNILGKFFKKDLV